MRFQGRIALITAGGRGIGRASAEIIGREGGTVVLGTPTRPRWTRRPAPSARVAAARTRSSPTRSTPRRSRARCSESCREHRRIDILRQRRRGSTVIGKRPRPSTSCRSATGSTLLHFNLTGTFLFCHAVVPVHEAQAAGKIVNISSIAGRGLSASSSAAYATAKGRHHCAHAQASRWSSAHSASTSTRSRRA